MVQNVHWFQVCADTDTSLLQDYEGTMWLPGTLAWLEPFLPGWRMLVVGVPVAALYSGAAAALAGWLRSRCKVRVPYTRKVFHFTIMSAAGVAHLAWGLPGVVILGSVTALLMLLAVVRGSGFPFYEAMARPSDAPHRTLFILIPLATTALGGVLSNLLFSPFAPIGYMVTGWGDAVGEPVGTRWGKHRYRVPSLAGVIATRSLEGSGAVFLAGAVAAALTLFGMGYSASVSVGAGVACGAAGAVVEAFSNHGLDNLTVQVATTALAWALLG